MTVTDVVPLQRGDFHGLTGLYLVVGWIVVGYLVAALVGVASGARPATTRRAFNRLIAFVPYAILSGLAGAIVTGPVLGALTGTCWRCGGSARCWCSRSAPSPWPSRPCPGVIGIGVTILVFVIFGNPRAGGAYQPALLPPFWRAT